MKKTITAVLIASSLTFAACGGTDETVTQTTPAKKTPTATPTPSNVPQMTEIGEDIASRYTKISNIATNGAQAIGSGDVAAYCAVVGRIESLLAANDRDLNRLAALAESPNEQDYYRETQKIATKMDKSTAEVRATAQPFCG